MLDAETVDYLTSPDGADALVETLLYHVILQVIPSTAIPRGQTFVDTALEDTKVLVVRYPVTLWVNRAKVIATDVLANNGIIHAIDKVLMPPSMRGQGKGKGRNVWKGKGMLKCSGANCYMAPRWRSTILLTLTISFTHRQRWLERKRRMERKRKG